MYRPWTVLLIVVAAVGCYTRRPTSLSPAPQARVRIVLATPTALIVLAPGDSSSRREVAGVLEASGSVLAAAGDTISVRLGELRTIDGAVPNLASCVALVPVHSIASVSERRLDMGRTVLAGAGVLVLASTVAVMVLIVTIVKAAGG